MPKAKELTVAGEDRPGTLAYLARVLGDAKVNILACRVGGDVCARVIVDNANKAKKALDAAGLSYTEADVLHVELPNKPGSLGGFAGKLAARNINIHYGYVTAAQGARKASVVLAVSDLNQAARIR